MNTKQMEAFADRVSTDGLTICPDTFEHYLDNKEKLSDTEYLGMLQYFTMFRRMFGEPEQIGAPV